MYKIVSFSMQVIIRVVLWHLQSSQVKQTSQDSINELISSSRFQIHLLIPECIMSSEFTRGVLWISTRSVSWIWWKCLQRNFIYSKIFNLTEYRRYHKKFTAAHYACRDAHLNLILVVATAKGFNFRMINSLMGCYLCLAWLDLASL